MYGVGQGLEEGVRMAGSFLTDAMKMKQQQQQQQQRFDATMERDRDRMILEKAWVDARQKLFHDRLAIQHGWDDGRAGRPSMFDAQDEQPALPPDAFPRTPSPTATRQTDQVPAPRPIPSSTTSTPAQATIRPMQMTPAQYLLPAPRIVGKPAREFMPSMDRMPKAYRGKY